MKRIFYPSSIVVIGVSDSPDNLAQNILGNLRAFGYKGSLYGVGRREAVVHGVPVVTSLDEVPGGVDLAVILTPARLVPGFIETCGRKGILRVVIESGGFGEFSDEGRALEQQLVETAARWGIRFVGPNCISVVNLENGVCLPFAPLTTEDMRLGPGSVIAQSGGVSITYMHRLCLAGVGANKGVSIGNKTDLDETDYLSYLLDDPGTEMVILYLESISNGPRLLELARGSAKPIVIHKANRSQASRSVAFSHTAALADDDRVVTAAFHQAGIIRAEGFRDLVAVAQGLALPPVRGDDLVVISRSGGHAVVAADAAERYGFRLNPLPEAFSSRVRELFRADVITPTNPLDLGVIFDFDLYARIVEATLQALSPSAILLINTYGTAEAEGADRLAHRVDEIVRETKRPVAFIAYSRARERDKLQGEIHMPLFYEIEEALRGLAASRDRQSWLARQTETLPISLRRPTPDVRELLAEGAVPADRALELIGAYGIRVARGEAATTPEEAANLAAEIGFPVALKALAAELPHKSDMGGVALSLRDPASVEREGRRILSLLADRFPGAPAGLLVQAMAGPGAEVIVGGRRDPTFGPVVMLGIGGVFVEALEDVAFRVAPLTSLDADEMIDALRGRAVLEGARGRPRASRHEIVKALTRVSQLMEENPDLAEVEINPLIVTADEAVAVDARALVRRP
jgi:acetyltransferase